MVLKAKLHTQGGPRRRPALARARQGRRIQLGPLLKDTLEKESPDRQCRPVTPAGWTASQLEMVCPGCRDPL